MKDFFDKTICSRCAAIIHPGDRVGSFAGGTVCGECYDLLKPRPKEQVFDKPLGLKVFLAVVVLQLVLVLVFVKC